MNIFSNTRIPFVPPFFYGWIIVFIAILGIFFSGPGQTYSNAIFIDYYIADFGWSRSLVSGIYSAATLAAGLCMFYVGRFVDTFGQRQMSVGVAFLLALACFWNSFVTGPIMLFIGFFLIRLFGQGSMTLVHTTLVPQWFLKYRGRALSFMAVGGFISAAAFPPINAWLMETWNWQTAWQFWGALLLVLFIPLSFFLIRNKPEEVGLVPDGLSMTAFTESNTTVPEISWSLPAARKTKTFWLVLLCVSIPSMVNTGLIFHFFSILGEQGISVAQAAFVLSLIAIIGFPSTLIAGIVLEKVQVNIILVYVFAVQAVAMTLLLFTNNIGWALAFGILRGITEGFERVSLNIVWPNYFGREHLGSIKGVAMTATVIGSAFGPLPFAIGYDLTGGYVSIILIMLLFPVLGIVASLLMRSPQNTN